ncbi:MAG: transglutaminase domain-containing protein [Acidobacteriota bacterium]
MWFLGSWQRTRLLLYEFHEVPSEAHINLSPEQLLATVGFEEDAVDQLVMFRHIADPIVAGASSSAERARRLGDYIYSLRHGAQADVDGDVRRGPVALLRDMQSGEPGNCGQMSVVLAAFWRSLGGHTRGVRWATPDGEVGHYALELWDQDAQRWFYYDMNMNGYAADANGRTLSIAALRSNLLTGENLHLEASLTVGDFTKEEFEQAVRDFPIEWYVLSNHSLNKEPGRRFGKLNRFHTWFERLPNPIDRVLDNLTGDRDRRLIVAGRVQIAGLTSLQGGRVLVGYLVLICLVSGVILFTQRRSSSRWSV